jgi:hypothetical protein
MGLFDGPIVKFAEKFCQHVEARAQYYQEAADRLDANQASHRSVYLTVALCLTEVSAALRTIAEL